MTKADALSWYEKVMAGSNPYAKEIFRKTKISCEEDPTDKPRRVILSDEESQFLFNVGSPQVLERFVENLTEERLFVANTWFGKGNSNIHLEGPNNMCEECKALHGTTSVSNRKNDDFYI